MSQQGIERHLMGTFTLKDFPECKDREAAEKAASDITRIPTDNLHALPHSEYGFTFRSTDDKSTLNEALKFIEEKFQYMTSKDKAIATYHAFGSGKGSVYEEGLTKDLQEKNHSNVLALLSEEALLEISKHLNK